MEIALTFPEAAPSDASVTAVLLVFSLSGTLRSGASVMPILSLPLQVVRGGGAAGAANVAHAVTAGHAAEQIRSVCSAVHASCLRPVSISSAELAPADSQRTVYAIESPGYLGIGGKVWDSLYVLLQYLHGDGREYITGKRVIELGCGTGIAGEAASFHLYLLATTASYLNLFFST